MAEDLALELSFAEAFADRWQCRDDLVKHVEAAEHVEDSENGEHKEDSDSEQETGSDDAEDEVLFACKSAPSPYLSNGEGRILDMPPLTERGQRSSSVPPRPLKSAMARSLSPTKSDNDKPKRAHFTESATQSRESLQRSSTDPGRVHQPIAPLERTFTEHRFARNVAVPSISTPGHNTASRVSDDQELVAAIGVFEAVVGELVQVAEEDAEAHRQLVQVAREVAMIISEETAEKASYEDAQSLNDEENDAHRSTISEFDRDSGSNVDIVLSRRSSSIIDTDIDKSDFPEQGAKNRSYDEEKQPGDEANSMDLRRSSQDFARNGKGRISECDPIVEGGNSSTETVWAISSRDSEYAPTRRFSHQEQGNTVETNVPDLRRRLSTGDMRQSGRQLKLPPLSAKAGPASCAVTACSVRAVQPTIHTIYQHRDPLYSRRQSGSTPLTTAQTVRSESGTFQVLWEDSLSSSVSSAATFQESPPKPGTSSPVDEASFPGQPSPMEKVKTKLAVWSWARDQGLDPSDGRPSWIPLLDPDKLSAQAPHGMSKRSSHHDEQPFNPPNSQRTSVARSPMFALTPEMGVSPGQSAPPSPLIQARSPNISEDDEEQPLELKTKSSSSRAPSTACAAVTDYLSVPLATSRSTPSTPSEQQVSLPRALSNLMAEEMRFKTHRNSLDLLQARQHDEGRMNHNLMNSQDSMILARSKFNEKYPSAVLDIRPAWSRADVLSRISDASPLNVGSDVGVDPIGKHLLSPRGVGGKSALQQRRMG